MGDNASYDSYRMGTHTVAATENVRRGRSQVRHYQRDQRDRSCGNDMPSKAVTTIPNTVIDTTSPTITYSTAIEGGVSDGTTTWINAGDIVSVVMEGNEHLTAQPTVQFKNNTTNLGSAVTAARDGTVIYDYFGASGDPASAVRAIDYGAPSDGLTRESVGSGYVYKTTRAFDSLYIGVYGDADSTAIIKSRSDSSQPSASTIRNAGNEILVVNSRGSSSTFYGSVSLTNVASGTYVWFYPVGSRTITNRGMVAVEGISASRTTSFSSGTQSGSDTAGASDPIDLGAVSAAGITRETLGSGYVYKTTRPYQHLSIGTSVVFSAAGTYAARYAATKPATTTLATHGTALWSEAVNSGGNTVSGGKIISAVPAGTYFWFYPSVANTVTSRLLELRGVDDVTHNSGFIAPYTVGATDSITSGNLRYDVTNELLVKDTAGNAIAAKVLTAIPNVATDQAAPTISSVAASGTTLTVTMSESVYAATTPDLADFVVTGGGSPSVSGISGLQTAAGSADNSFTLTIAAALTNTATLAYTQNSTDSKRIKDRASTALASASINISGTPVSAPAAPTLALQSPSLSPGSDSTPTIRVTVDGTQQNGSVELFSNSTCTTSISSSTTVDAATEDVTVTTTLTEAGSPYSIYAKHTNSNSQSTCSTTFVSYSYDNTAPTISSVAASGTTLTVTMSESVYAASTPETVDFTITGGGDPFVDTITGLQTAASSADNSFTLTTSEALNNVATIAYVQDSNKLIKDVAGHSLASSGDITISGLQGPPDAPTLALQSPSASPGNSATPTIRVTVDSTQQNGTVELFSDSECLTSISSATTVDAATEDVTVTTTLTEDESPYTIYAKHTNSNTQNTCSTTFVSYTYDGTVPTISSASFAAGSIITITMSENVYAATTPTASDFKVKSGDSGSETANTVTTITGLPTVKASADSSFTLTVTTALVSGNSVKVYYTKGTNAVTDTASNALATIAESSAITATEPDPEPTTSFDPPDGANLLSASDDIEISFGDSIYADTSGTDFTDDTIDALFTLKQDHSDGSGCCL